MKLEKNLDKIDILINNVSKAIDYSVVRFKDPGKARVE